MDKGKKQLNLTQDAFNVNENGEVIINDEKLKELLTSSIDETGVGEQGIKITVSF